jgi:hypothetical protein
VDLEKQSMSRTEWIIVGVIAALAILIVSIHEVYIMRRDMRLIYKILDDEEPP